jgi:hypothetical protein
VDRAPHDPVRPTSPLGWLAFAWAVLGSALVLVEAVARLLPRALVLLDDPAPAPLLAAAGWSVFMVWAEGWRGFHRRFNPRLVARAARLASRPWPSVVLGPLVVMGLVDATPRRLGASWMLVAMIVALVVGVQQLPEPWRAAVDLGVVLGLSVGTASLAVHAVQVVRGRAVAVDPEFAQGRRRSNTNGPNGSSAASTASAERDAGQPSSTATRASEPR